jgi:hypothetical protein
MADRRRNSHPGDDEHHLGTQHVVQLRYAWYLRRHKDLP